MAIGPALPQIPLVLDTDVFTAWRYRSESTERKVSEYEATHKRPPALISTIVFEALRSYERTIFERGGADKDTERGRAEARRLIELYESIPSGPSTSGILSFDKHAADIAAYVAGRLHKH